MIPGGTRWSATTVPPWCCAMRIREPQRELRVRAAAHRHEDPPDLPRATLLDDGDVARGLADDLVDRRREDGHALAVATRAGLPAPAEDDQIRLALGGRLDDALRGVPPDAHDGWMGAPSGA